MATERGQQAARAAVAMIVGVGGAALGLAAAYVLVVFIGFGCHGSDVSEPSGSALCTDPIPAIVTRGGLFGATGAPLLGMIVAVGIRRFRPVVVGCFASAAILLVMVLFTALAHERNSSPRGSQSWVFQCVREAADDAAVGLRLDSLDSGRRGTAALGC